MSLLNDHPVIRVKLFFDIFSPGLGELDARRLEFKRKTSLQPDERLYAPGFIDQNASSFRECSLDARRDYSRRDFVTITGTASLQCVTSPGVLGIRTSDRSGANHVRGVLALAWIVLALAHLELVFLPASYGQLFITVHLICTPGDDTALASKRR